MLLFTQKKSTPPLFKSLSKDFKGIIVMGEVRSSEIELCQKFGVAEFPKIIVLTDPQDHKGPIYEGELKKDQLMKFIRKHAYVSE